MPSLCVTPRRLGDPRAVPCFRWPFFVDMSPSQTPGSSSVASTQFLHRRRRPSPKPDGLGTSHIPPSDSIVGKLNFGASLQFSIVTTCRLACPPVGADQVLTQPTRTFTSGLPTDWSPAPPPDMTTGGTGQAPLMGLSPTRTPTSIAATGPGVSVARFAASNTPLTFLIASGPSHDALWRFCRALYCTEEPQTRSCSQTKFGGLQCLKHFFGNAGIQRITTEAHAVLRRQGFAM